MSSPLEFAHIQISSELNLIINLLDFGLVFQFFALKTGVSCELHLPLILLSLDIVYLVLLK